MFHGLEADEARGFSTEWKAALLYNRCFRQWENGEVFLFSRVEQCFSRPKPVGETGKGKEKEKEREGQRALTNSSTT